MFANAYPLLEMDARGLTSLTTIFGTVRALGAEGMPSVAVLVFATALLLPAIELGAMLYMLVPLRLRFVPPGLLGLFEVAAWSPPPTASDRMPGGFAEPVDIGARMRQMWR